MGISHAVQIQILIFDTVGIACKAIVSCSFIMQGEFRYLFGRRILDPLLHLGLTVLAQLLIAIDRCRGTIKSHLHRRQIIRADRERYGIPDLSSADGASFLLLIYDGSGIICTRIPISAMHTIRQNQKGV